jgi:NAD(P)-dependent dehydrogenase (short-subunit alcohol dehydrogenase family)
MAGRTIMVTGSTGIAAASAELLAADGAQVFIASRTEANAAGLAARLRAAGAEADHVAVDLADDAGANLAVDACRARFGRVDGLLAVAGGSGRRYGDGPLDTVTGEAWDATMSLNLRSQALVLAAVLRVMLDQQPDDRGRRGAVVLVSSVLATDPVPGLFATHAYAASKGAIDALVRTTAATYAPQGIRINGLACGLTDTPMAARAAADPATAAFARRKQPLAGGLLDPRDVARGARFLLSDEAAMISGQRLVVDGGWSVTSAAPQADA